MLIRAAIPLALIITIAALYRHYASHPSTPADPVFIEKLKSAKHYRSEFPAQKQTLDLAKKSNLRNAALNAIGMELRDVRGMANGNPDVVFGLLSHLGGFGEIIWVDQWTNFPIKLPPKSPSGQLDVPRRDAVRAMLDAIDASDACLVRAGPNRYLVAKVSEKKNTKQLFAHWIGLAMAALRGIPKNKRKTKCRTQRIRRGNRSAPTQIEHHSPAPGRQT